MTVKTRFVILGLCCLGLPVRSAGSSFDEDPKQARAILADFARCAVKYQTELSRNLVLSTYTLSKDELEKVLDPQCFGLWRMNFYANDLALKAAFAEALVRREAGQRPELVPLSRTPLDWPVPVQLHPGPGVDRIDPAFAKKALDKLVADSKVGRLGECVVRASPSGAVAVLNTKMDSSGEIATLKALTPQIAGCIKAGETPAFNRTNLRYAIALSYYRLAHANAVPSRRAVTQ